MKKGLRLACLLSVLLGACTLPVDAPDRPFDSAGGLCASYDWLETTPSWGMSPRYAVQPTIVSAKGVKIDPSSNRVNPATVDRLVDAVETCLTKNFGNPPVIPPDVQQASQCPSATFTLPINRACLTIKIPDDWSLNCDGTQQVLSWVTADGGAGCRAKGLSPTAECPCRWRAGVQDSHTLVATPSLYLAPDWVIRIFTGCQNPWASPELAECAAPQTGPLDNSL